MALTKAKKSEAVDKLTGAVKGATSAAFVGFNALTVAEANELRAALKKEGVKYVVVKKTLFERALDASGIEGDKPALPGAVAMAHLPKDAGDDPTAPLRTLNEFVKKFKDRLVFLGGLSVGKYLSKVEAAALAAIPPVAVLRGMFANVINTPRSRFAVALGEVSKKKA